MDGGVALNGTSDSHSQLADRIKGGAMDMNGAASVADSTLSGRLYGIQHLCTPHELKFA
jgi:regulator of ribosome biosynthesis